MSHRYQEACILIQELQELLAIEVNKVLAISSIINNTRSSGHPGLATTFMPPKETAAVTSPYSKDPAMR